MSTAEDAAPDRGARTAVYQRIREDIAIGALPPGEWVREGPIADALGVSRTPVREALNALAAEGVVEIVRNRGARVSSWTMRDVDEIYSLRALLESEGARLAVERASGRERERLAVQQHRFDAAAVELSALRGQGQGRSANAQRALETAVDANAHFHRIVLDAAQSPRLVALLASVSSTPRVALAFQHYSDADLARSTTGHHDIALALERRDPVLAEAAMRSHILGARHAATRSASDNPESAVIG